MAEPESEFEVTVGTVMTDYFKRQFRKKRISILNGTKIKKIHGEGEIKRIVFTIPGDIKKS